MKGPSRFAWFAHLPNDKEDDRHIIGVFVRNCIHLPPAASVPRRARKEYLVSELACVRIEGKQELEPGLPDRAWPEFPATPYRY